MAVLRCGVEPTTNIEPVPPEKGRISRMLAQLERLRSATLEESGDGTPSQIAAFEASDHLFKTVDSQLETGA